MMKVINPRNNLPEIVPDSISFKVIKSGWCVFLQSKSYHVSSMQVLPSKLVCAVLYRKLAYMFIMVPSGLNICRALLSTCLVITRKTGFPFAAEKTCILFF